MFLRNFLPDSLHRFAAFGKKTGKRSSKMKMALSFVEVCSRAQVQRSGRKSEQELGKNMFPFRRFTA